MAFSTGSGKGPQTDINVTPLVDVVLVLLIIFMVVTPLLQVDMPADIPKPPEDIQVPPPDAPIQVVIQVKSDGTYVNTDRMADDAMLKDRLATLMRGRKDDDKIAFVSGEESLAFERVVHAMDVARGAGVLNVGIIDPL